MQKSHIINKVLLNTISINEVCLHDFIKNKKQESPVEGVWMWDDGTNILWDNDTVILID